MKALELIPNNDTPNNNTTYQRSSINLGILDSEKYNEAILKYCNTWTINNKPINNTDNKNVTVEAP